MNRYMKLKVRLTVAEEHLQKYKEVARDYIRWAQVDRVVGNREDLLNDLIDAAHYRKLALEWAARVRRTKDKLWDAGIDLCIEECTKYLAEKGYTESLEVLTNPNSTDHEISSILHAYGFAHPEKLLEASR